MAKIKINPNLYSNETYSMRTKSLKFALVSSVRHGSKQVCGWSTCRDYLHDVIRGALHPDMSTGYTTRAHNDTSVVDLKRLRLLICSDNYTANKLLTKDVLFTGKRMLNIYEEFLGFSKSTIVGVDYKLAEKDKATTSVWLLNGSGEWIKSPHLLSILTLIIRIAHGLKAIPKFKDNSMEEVNNIIREFSIYRNQQTDASYAFSVGSVLPILLRHHKDLFIHPMSEAYDKSCGVFHSCGGIVSLCNGTSPVKALNKEVGKLLMTESNRAEIAAWNKTVVDGGK